MTTTQDMEERFPVRLKPVPRKPALLINPASFFSKHSFLAPRGPSKKRGEALREPHEDQAIVLRTAALALSTAREREPGYFSSTRWPRPETD